MVGPAPGRIIGRRIAITDQHDLKVLHFNELQLPVGLRLIEQQLRAEWIECLVAINESCRAWIPIVGPPEIATHGSFAVV